VNDAVNDAVNDTVNDTANDTVAGQPGEAGQEEPPPELRSAVVVGTGLIGTSIALALRERGVAVSLADRDPAAARLAADMGAGTVLPDPPPPGQQADLAVLGVPPAAVASTLAAAQAAGLARWYTDVASVKASPLREAAGLGCDLGSFVPGHPLSGRERSGPAAARADLFLGRPWVICAGPGTAPGALAAVAALVRCCRAEAVPLAAGDHDQYVALISHAPHVVAAAMAARLTGTADPALALAGQGIRDVTRIAAGDSGLWTQILSANAGPVAEVLTAVAADLTAAAEALREAAGAGQAAERAPALKTLAGLLDEGSAGVARIPGKHATARRDDMVVQVVIPDVPGELARLFRAAGEAGVNIEDIGIEHSPGLPVGVAELTVRPEAVARLTQALAASGWPVRR
jgi:prephenate dehydrogenase